MEKQLRLLNVRYGLATNSSSSHSLIFLRPGEQLGDKDIWGDGYGWNHFLLASKEEKLKYLAAQVYQAFEELHPDLRVAVVRAILDDASLEVDPNNYIDHQSTWSFPRAFGKKYVDADFIREVIASVRRNGVVIAGGNDDEAPTWKKKYDNRWYPRMLTETANNQIVCRNDGNGQWVVFNKDNGNKLRFSVVEMLSNDHKNDGWISSGDASNHHSPAPELVDLKITDYCPYDCPFCYQTSTRSGVHGESRNIYAIISALAEMKVFEIAFGGGEPTLHPKFGEFLQYAYRQDIVANFTTRNLAWLSEKDNHYLDYAGAFAYSVDEPSGVEALVQALDKRDISHHRANVHVVMGAQPIETFRNILAKAREFTLRVTLLGYKMAGRGGEFTPFDYSTWLETATDLQKSDQCPTLSIDTLLAKEYEARISQVLPDWMYHTVDGRHSAYIDAISMKIAPDSYSGEAGQGLGESRDYSGSIRKAFSEWQTGLKR
ncbi:MAG: radical SAM protein [Anaerolineae bacterium]|nr:radical SAM protein [Anaerolineae bacterium]